MELAHRWRDRNLTRLEFIVSCILIALFIGLFIRSTLVVFARTEQTMVNTTIVNINSALQYQAAIAVMLGDTGFISRSLDESPFNLLQSAQASYTENVSKLKNQVNVPVNSFMNVPANYIGEMDNPEPEQIEPGQWYYDVSDHTLNYRIRNTVFFRDGGEGLPIMKYQVVVDYDDRNGNGVFDQGIDTYNSIKLKSIESIKSAKQDKD